MEHFVKKLKRHWWALKLTFARVYYNDPSMKLKVVGVTGTNGKTTIATLLYKIATALGYKAGLLSTVEILVAGKKRNINPRAKIPGTTPDSITLTKIFREMLDAGCEYVFMEVSSHAMDQGRVNKVHFTGGIFTNLTQDHLDYHKSMENYFLAKRKFFTSLGPTAFALANDEDEHAEAMLDGINAKQYYYGFTDTADFKAELVKIDFNGIEMKVGGETVKSKLLGRFNAYNVLAVWSACFLLGWSMDKVSEVMPFIDPPRGRFEYFTTPKGVLVVVDYAHTPDALEKIIKAVKEVKPERGRIITVFGCGGDRDPLKRRIMGKIGASLSDKAIFTSDNPRSENPIKILDDMKVDLSIAELERTSVFPDRREAIRESIQMAEPGDVILCAGKGHEDYQEIRGVRHHFSDIEEYRKLFEE
jgi:UDP-N-acetylmuramoyl-L-alanyl-D-glutamate--2,6-diaminopimelate ligase